MTTIFSKCEKDGFGCADVAYQFDLSMRAYPDNSIVPLGDTIWLEGSSPNIFIDIPSGREVNFL